MSCRWFDIINDDDKVEVFNTYSHTSTFFRWGTLLSYEMDCLKETAISIHKLSDDESADYLIIVCSKDSYI